MKTDRSNFFVLVLIICSCQQPKDRLIGKWIRYGDELKGMCIQIENEGGSFKAEIISLPDNDSILYSGFYIGDIKWRDIKPITENKYEYVDLAKIPISNNPLKFTSRNGLARLEIVGDTIINTRVFSKDDEVLGTETHWKRQ